MRSDKFERQIQDKLEGVKMAPTPGLWAAIAEQMPPPQRKKRAAIWWWGGGSSLLAAALVFAWLSYQPGETIIATEIAPVELSTTESHPHPIGQPQEKESAVAAIKEPTSSQITTLPSLHTSTASPVLSQDFPTQVEPISSANADLAQAEIDQVDIRQKASREWYEITSLAALDQTKPHVWGAQADEVEGLETPGKWSLWTVIQPEMAGRGNPLGIFSPQTSDHSLVEQDQFGIGTAFPNHAYILQYPRQSFSAGALLSYRMSYRWSLQAGAILMVSEGGSLKHGDLDPTLLNEGPVRPEDAIRTYDLELSWRQSAIEMPVRAQYLVTRKGRHSLNAIGGISVNRALSLFRWSDATTQDRLDPQNLPEEVYATESQTIVTEGEQDLLRFRNWHAHLDGRILYGLQVRPQLGLYVGPSMKYHLRGSYAGLAARDQMRYRLGFELGMRFGGSV